MSSGDEAAVRRLYEDLIAGWNAGDATRMAAPFAAGGAVIGYDGSEQTGRDAIEAEMRRIFADHEIAAYVTKVKSVAFPSADVGLLRASGWSRPGGPSSSPRETPTRPSSPQDRTIDGRSCCSRTRPRSSMGGRSSSSR